MLGYSVSYFLGREWRNTPLYAQKIIPLLDYLLSNNFVYSDKLSGSFYELINKYQNPSELPVESLKELVKEMGYDYILNLLADDDEIVKILVYLLVLIHQLKGSKQGLELVMSLFSYGSDRLNIAIREWFKDIPTNNDESDVLYWFKKIPTDKEGIIDWLAQISADEQNLTIQEWIANIPDSGISTDIYNWYLNIPVSYDIFFAWLNSLTFEQDNTITEWFETINPNQPLGEENTFEMSTKIDVSKVNKDFFKNFTNFIHNYIYPELANLKVSTVIENDVTQIPYSTMKENFNARGRVTGFDGTEGDDVSKKYSGLNPFLTSIDGECVWEMPNPFGSEYVITNIFEVATGQQVMCNIEQNASTVKVYFDSDVNINADIFAIVIMA